MVISPRTTHIWKEGLKYRGTGVFARFQYRKISGEWYALDVYGNWCPTLNHHSWFEEESKQGFLVTVEEWLDSLTPEQLDQIE